jgi:four helix bundle protein
LHPATRARREGGMNAVSFEFQKWPVYQSALELVRLSYELCAELPKDSATGLRDQLRRASQSIPLNIAEGSVRYTSRDKANFFRIARGSVFECVAVVDLVVKLGFAKRDYRELLSSFETLSRMLSGLINYVESEQYRNGKKSAPRISMQYSYAYEYCRIQFAAGELNGGEERI